MNTNQVIIDNLIVIAHAKVEQYHREWHDEHLKLTKMISDCKLTHSTPPNNYWVNEHRAKARFDLALQLLASIVEIKNEILAK